MASIVNARPGVGGSVQESIQIASGATLAGLLIHYATFYLLGTPLLTDQISEWIMARTPSRYAVPILDSLGRWAKPSAATGALAILGFTIFLLHISSKRFQWRSRLASFTMAGILLAGLVAWNTGYSSFGGSVAFWLPALAVAASRPSSVATKNQLELRDIPASSERRTLLKAASSYALPVVMSSGVVAVAAESYFRSDRLARQAREPVDLFPFLPALDRERLGRVWSVSPSRPVSEFYGMSKNTVDPVIDTGNWKLTIAVNGQPVRTYRFEDLLRIKRNIRYVTCGVSVTRSSRT